MAFHSPFYTPVYVAHRLGAFQAEALLVTLSVAPPGQATELIQRGEADLAVSGLMRSYVLADQPEPRRLLSIAEINSRDGFFILARRSEDGFNWPDLEGSRLILFAEAPTPWMCLLDVLRRHGVSLERISVLRGLGVPQAVEAFLRGEADYLQTGQPVAEQLLDAGAAHLAAAMAEAVGRLPYSSLLVTPEFRRTRPDLCQRAVGALARAQRWIARNDPTAVADLIAPDFASVSVPILRKVVARFQAAGTWPPDPYQVREPVEGLGRILVAGGLIRRAAPFDQLVDNTFAGSIQA
jgi:NitT/TauT family transport system substrate-binding protein